MIEGLNVRCNVGPLTVLRTPYLKLTSRRRALLSRAEILIPDPEGEARAVLAAGQAVTVRFGFRGEAGFWQEWEGTLTELDQPPANSPAADAVLVRAAGLEKALQDTVISESFYRETASAAARRILSRTGLGVSEISIPDEILPHMVFSGVSAARAVKQISHTLERSFGCDMSRHALWLGASGLVWSAGDEPGSVYRAASAENLIAHTPPAGGSAGELICTLLPGLAHSRRIRILDARRGTDKTVRVESAEHILDASGCRTILTYGQDFGWL